MAKRIGLPYSLLLLSLLLLWGFTPDEAAAQSSTPDKDENCIGCHENLYYLHDTGKWYCLCSVPARCTDCHGGNPDTLVENEAHIDLIAQPAAENADTCQGCHPDDFETRIETFASLAGIKTAHPDSPVFHTARPASEDVSPVSSTVFFLFRELKTWQWLGIGILGILAVGVFYFGYCCWKFDCCNRSNDKRSISNQ